MFPPLKASKPVFEKLLLSFLKVKFFSNEYKSCFHSNTMRAFHYGGGKNLLMSRNSVWSAGNLG